MSWVRGSNKQAQIAGQDFGIWYWRVCSNAYPALCEVDGDLYWTDSEWENKCREYCDEVKGLKRRGIDVIEFERQRKELLAKLKKLESKLSKYE